MTAEIVRGWAGACLVLSVAARSFAASPLPRYELKPGQVLTYEDKQSYRGKGENQDYKTIWRFWVVGKNDDGSWRIVAQTAMTTLAQEGSAARDDMVSVARFDVHPDGEAPYCPTLGTRIDPAQIFPRLPGDDKQLAAGWEARDDRDEATTTYKSLAAKGSADASTFEFQASRRSFTERIYEGADHRTFHFDRKRGVITRGEIARSYGSHMQSEGKGTLELASVTEMAPGELTSFRDEMDRYFTAHQAYLAIYRKVEKSGDEADALMNKARKILADARASVTLPEPIAALDLQLKNHNQFARHQVDGAKRFAKVIGQPAAAWEIKDFDGQTHTLDQYRGKVLVLDFWYRGCGWCMRAMPQVKRLASHYRGQPVAVFGMNNDQKEVDAKFVIKEMQLDYPVLRSLNLPQKYGVQGFPTVVIIDQKGNVADIQVGYSSQLFEEVTAVVDRLLAAK
jgi:thiol-disulfide isomerase/thioredoxin